MYLRHCCRAFEQIAVMRIWMGSMIVKIALAVLAAFAPCMLMSAEAVAQDVPGIEICTVEKTMERRTSCLQSNVDFLQKTITKLATTISRSSMPPIVRSKP